AELLIRKDAKTLAKVADKLDAREKELTEQLDALQRKNAFPAGECWGEAMSLIDAIDAAPDPKEARIKLQGLLRQLVESIWILVVPKSATRRVAAVQVFFASGAVRHYLIFCQGAGRGREGYWTCPPSPYDEAHDPTQLDLRRREDAAALEAELLEMDL